MKTRPPASTRSRGVASAAPTGAANIWAAGGMARRRSTGRRRATLQPPPTGSATTTGSSATRPTPARAVQQSLATGRVISHQVVVPGVALMRSRTLVEMKKCAGRSEGKEEGNGGKGKKERR
jgi:hypothetical protein